MILTVQRVVIVLYIVISIVPPPPHHPCAALTISSCLYHYISAYLCLPIALKINRPLLNSLVQLRGLRTSTVRYRPE